MLCYKKKYVHLPDGIFPHIWVLNASTNYSENQTSVQDNFFFQIAFLPYLWSMKFMDPVNG